MKTDSLLDGVHMIVSGRNVSIFKKRQQILVI